jgi:hypothetical protein
LHINPVSSPEDYFNQLDIIGADNIVEYVRMLALWPSAGILLTPYAISGMASRNGISPGLVLPDGNTTYNILLPQAVVNRHRLLYAQAIRQFATSIMTRYLSKAFSILDYTKMEDLPSLKAAYSHLINSELEFEKAINQKPIIKVFAPNGILAYSVKGGIPDRLESQFSPVVASTDSIQGCLDVTYPDRVRSAKDALRYEFAKAKQILLMQEVKLAARVAQAQSDTIPMKQTTYSQDPYSNIHAMFDPEASREQGSPVFRNVAVNLSREYMATRHNEIITPSYGPSLEDYAKVPEVRERYKRMLLDSGGKLSLQEMQDLYGVGNDKKNIGLWVAGGIAVAAIASQAL